MCAGIIAYCFIGFETKERSFEEIGAALTGPSPVKAPAGVGAVPAGPRFVIRVHAVIVS